ncbi:MAG: Gfo/Idh/MocA family oxidoreductase [Pirellulales bacterium]|nr:Gfo/Idh/MocA family oxidoreductase [Pirellulales bacterium]
MNLTPQERAAGRQNFELSRRGFLAAGAAAGVVAGGSLGAFYFGYDASHTHPIRVGVIGTGDEGSVLIGAINPDFLQVTCIADVRPYNVHRAFHGDYSSDTALAVRPGLMAKYGWKTEDEARRRVKVYADYREMIEAERGNLDGVIVALPLHLHAPAAIAAMKAGLHVLTEKLMGHGVRECKEMARVAASTGLHLATGHQRHYNILYHEAMDTIQRGVLGDLHYIQAQWHRGNLPGNDSWQQPLPPGVIVADPADDPEKEDLAEKLVSWQKALDNATGREIDYWRRRVAQLKAQLADAVLNEKLESGKTRAEQYGYQPIKLTDSEGKPVHEGPALEELIRWRLWDRTGGGLMAELGSHQLDAASLFLSALHGGKKPHPLSVAALANRPLFPPDRDADDHVACLFEFPAKGYDPKDPEGRRKKIGVQYASINGNGFGGYGEIVYGTKGTLILDREKEAMLFTGPAKTSVKAGASAGPTLDTQASGAVQEAAAGQAREVSRGYREQLEHWAWCIMHPAPENRPRCHPEVALADATIALVANISARRGQRIEFEEEWFDPNSDATPEGDKPDVGRYA